MKNSWKVHENDKVMNRLFFTSYEPIIFHQHDNRLRFIIRVTDSGQGYYIRQRRELVVECGTRLILPRNRQV